MISLQNDYSEGAHPQILKRLAEINLEQNPGYCTDSYCASAAEKIRQACACPEADIFFLVGGTQTTGHKVLELPHHEGKIEAAELQELVSRFWQDGNHEHMVFPGMVYISHPTEYGTLYSKRELEAIARVCHEHKMYIWTEPAWHTG